MTVNVLVFVYCVVFSVTRYMYDAWRRDFALSASFVSELECFDGSEVTRKVNDSIVQKQYCVVEEIIGTLSIDDEMGRRRRPEVKFSRANLLGMR